MAYVIDENLRQFALNDEQWEKYVLQCQYGSSKKAADNSQYSRSAIQRACAAIEKNAARHGVHAEIHRPAPPGYVVKGTSTLYDLQTGDPKIQWVKTDADKEAQAEAMREAVEALSEDIPRAKPIKPPKAVLDDLLNLYVITDYHMGMRAWKRETKQADWDVEIACKLLVNAFSQMMALSPDSKTGFVCQLGDFLHTDFPAFIAQSQSGHILDADGRAEKVIEATIKVLRQVVDMALSKHEKVIVLMAEGNHDLVGSVWLRSLFSALYENEPRVEVETSPLPFYAYQHGKTALFMHHGHLRKPGDIRAVFAAQFSKVWGECEFRYAHMGHYHHKHEKEDWGCTVTQHRTLAAKDSHSSRHAFFSERKAECLTYHKEYGIVGSVHVTPEMCDVG